MADDDLIREAEALVGAATSGPWIAHPGMAGTYIAGANAEPWIGEADLFCDAKFIAWAREGVPALVAALRERDALITQLRAILTRDETVMADQVETIKSLTAERDDALRQLDDRFATSDHKAAVWYRRWREATR